MSLQIKPYRIPPNSSRRNYAFPPDDCSFAGIQDPSLKSFANSLRKQPSRKVVYPGDDSFVYVCTSFLKANKLKIAQNVHNLFYLHIPI